MPKSCSTHLTCTSVPAVLHAKVLLHTPHLYLCASCSTCQGLAPYTSPVPLCQLFYMPRSCSIHLTCTSVPAVLHAKVLLHTPHLYLCASCSTCQGLAPYTSPVPLCQLFYMPRSCSIHLTCTSVPAVLHAKVLLHTPHLYLCASCSTCQGLAPYTSPVPLCQLFYMPRSCSIHLTCTSVPAVLHAKVLLHTPHLYLCASCSTCQGLAPYTSPVPLCQLFYMPRSCSIHLTCTSVPAVLHAKVLLHTPHLYLCASCSTCQGLAPYTSPVPLCQLFYLPRSCSIHLTCTSVPAVLHAKVLLHTPHLYLCASCSTCQGLAPYTSPVPLCQLFYMPRSCSIHLTCTSVPAVLHAKVLLHTPHLYLCASCSTCQGLAPYTSPVPLCQLFYMPRSCSIHLTCTSVPAVLHAKVLLHTPHLYLCASCSTCQGLAPYTSPVPLCQLFYLPRSCSIHLTCTSVPAVLHAKVLLHTPHLYLCASCSTCQGLAPYTSPVPLCQLFYMPRSCSIHLTCTSVPAVLHAKVLLHTPHLYLCASCSTCQGLAPYTSPVPLCQLFYMPRSCSIHLTCTSVPAVLHAKVLLHTPHLYLCASCSTCQGLAPYTSPVPLCQLFYMPRSCSIHLTCTSVPAVLHAKVLLHTSHLYLCASCSTCQGLAPYTSPVPLCQLFYMPKSCSIHLTCTSVPAVLHAKVLLHTPHLHLCASCYICLCACSTHITCTSVPAVLYA